jgi:hypothetical protein
MLTLPAARVSYVKSFGLMTGLCLSLFGLFCHQFAFERWFIPWQIGSLVVVGFGLYYPCVFSRPYRLYNLLARCVAHYCSIAVSGLCFFFILATVKQKESKINLRRPEVSAVLWATRKPYPRAAYWSQFSLPLMGNGQDFFGWIVEFVSWGFKSRKYWVYCLLPFLGLLFLLDEGKDIEIPSDVYTLF